MLSFGAAKAQIQKKDVLIGGSVGLAAASYNGVPSQSLSLSPNVQFAYKNNRALGFSVQSVYSSGENNSGNKTRSLGISTGIFFVQYHKIREQYGWFLQQGAGYAHSKSTTETSGTDVVYKSSSYYGNISTGAYYAPGGSGKYLLWLNVGGLYANIAKPEAGNKYWNAGLSLFQSYSFGFAYNLRRKALS